MIFSYDEYRSIITFLVDEKKIPVVDYADVSDETSRFLILRHDVEYSPDRAMQLALFEAETLGVRSSYFFQLRNNTYNVISDRNRDIIDKIRALGHKVGLHVHLGALGVTSLDSYIASDISLMEELIQIEIDRFSYHRPTQKTLMSDVKIPNKINAYDDSYFHFYAGSKPDNMRVTYLSDSNHSWKFGHPMDLSSNAKKVQLLTHPFSWSKTGYNNLNNFKILLCEKGREMISSINDEIKTFPSELLE